KAPRAGQRVRPRLRGVRRPHHLHESLGGIVNAVTTKVAPASRPVNDRDPIANLAPAHLDRVIDAMIGLPTRRRSRRTLTLPAADALAAVADRLRPYPDSREVAA